MYIKKQQQKTELRLIAFHEERKRIERVITQRIPPDFQRILGVSHEPAHTSPGERVENSPRSENEPFEHTRVAAGMSSATASTVRILTQLTVKAVSFVLTLDPLPHPHYPRPTHPPIEPTVSLFLLPLPAKYLLHLLRYI